MLPLWPPDSQIYCFWTKPPRGYTRQCQGTELFGISIIEGFLFVMHTTQQATSDFRLPWLRFSQSTIAVGNILMLVARSLPAPLPKIYNSFLWIPWCRFLLFRNPLKRNAFSQPQNHWSVTTEPIPGFRRIFVPNWKGNTNVHTHFFHLSAHKKTLTGRAFLGVHYSASANIGWVALRFYRSKCKD